VTQAQFVSDRAHWSWLQFAIVFVVASGIAFLYVTPPLDGLGIHLESRARGAYELWAGLRRTSARGRSLAVAVVVENLTARARREVSADQLAVRGALIGSDVDER
jgi:hypothetical protein